MLKHESIMDLIQYFFYVYWNNHVTFVPDTIYVQHYIYQIAYIKLSLHPCYKTDLVMVCEYFYVLLNLFSNIFEDFFSIAVYQGYCSTVFLSSCPYLVSVSEWYWILKHFGGISYLSSLWNNLKSIWWYFFNHLIMLSNTTV